MNNSEKVYSEYYAKYGDTISIIAQKNGIDADYIMKFNNILDKNNIQTGQKINIPIIFQDEILDMSYFKYIPNENEKLSDIVVKFGVKANELYDFNNINKDEMKMPHVLKIPYYGQIKENNDQHIIYVVKEGDTLQSIASEYGLTKQELINYNKLVNEKVIIGTNIKIPIYSNNANNYFEYIIRNKENLEDIAKNYGYTISELMSFNNLETSLLDPGTVIKIPTK